MAELGKSEKAVNVEDEKNNDEEKKELEELVEEYGLSPGQDRLREYFIKVGLMAESRTEGKDLQAEKARKLQELRRAQYHNIRTLLDKYRHLKRALEFMYEEYTDRLLAEAGDSNPTVEPIHRFNALYERLELDAVRDSNSFTSKYVPQIETGRRIEFALSSLENALKWLKKFYPIEYEMVDFVFIQGRSKPHISDTLEKFNIGSSSVIYNRVEKAVNHLSEYMFGTENVEHRRELMSIIYLIQETSDEVSTEI